MRRTVIAGNLKMNLNRARLEALVSGLAAAPDQLARAEVILCPPFPLLAAARDLVAKIPVELGAQNMHWEREGAFTGEVSAGMLVEAGCSHVILGHSERRMLFGETDEAVSRKAGAALEAGLTPILCIGESLTQREAGETEAVLAAQLEGSCRGLTSGAIIVAYEPVWAIGTGRTATPAQAQEAHAFIRERLGSLLGPERASEIRILYGGSVKGENAPSLLQLEDVDGALVGGASLTPEGFLPILAGAPD